jgi:hypothetical protein
MMRGLHTSLRSFSPNKTEALTDSTDMVEMQIAESELAMP